MNPGGPQVPLLIGGCLTATQRERLPLFQSASLDVLCFWFHLLLFFTLPSSTDLLRFKGENSVSGRFCFKSERKSAFLSQILFPPLVSFCLFLFFF